MRILTNLQVDWIGKRKLFYSISGFLLFIGLVNILIRGLNFGIDFNGGSEIVLQFEKQVNIADIRNYVENIGLGNVEVKTFGGETGVLVRTEEQQIPSNIFPTAVENVKKEIEKIVPGLPFSEVERTSNSITYSFTNRDTVNTILNKLNLAGYQATKESEDNNKSQIQINLGVAQWLKENIRDKVKNNSFKVLKEDRVGPKVGSELKRDALLAILLSLVVILIYLAFRFKFIFAVGAVVALFHDVLITLGLYAILYGVIPGLNLEIDLTVVAAFLTLTGYSMNDTVVVFDRVRENLKIHKTLPLGEVINKSINQTMSRTIITGVTTLLTVFVLLLMGGDVLRAFAFTIFFGIIIGTYSSIFVASALVYEYAQRSKKKVQFT
jgi:preprotein translocase subunit SecF